VGLLKQGSPIRGFEESGSMVGEIVGVIGGIVAIIIGIGSILGWFVFLGSWKGKIDSLLNQENECFKVVPLAVQDLKTKMDLVWQVQSLEILERQKIAVHNEGPFTKRESPLAITERGHRCLKTMEPLLVELRGIPNLRPSDVPKFVDAKIGMYRLNEMAFQQKCTTGELLALITVSLGFGL